MSRLIQTGDDGILSLLVSLCCTIASRRLTSSMCTIIPDCGFSPVGSTQAKSLPKSLNTDLMSAQHAQDLPLDLPEQSPDVGSNEVDALCAAELVDFHLLRDRSVGEDNSLASAIRPRGQCSQLS